MACQDCLDNSRNAWWSGLYEYSCNICFHIFTLPCLICEIKLLIFQTCRSSYWHLNEDYKLNDVKSKTLLMQEVSYFVIYSLFLFYSFWISLHYARHLGAIHITLCFACVLSNRLGSHIHKWKKLKHVFSKSNENSHFKLLHHYFVDPRNLLSPRLLSNPTILSSGQHLKGTLACYRRNLIAYLCKKQSGIHGKIVKQ